ncbi:carboxylesterase/lipase family protein [Saccharopolyspora sp. 6V]|uniref:carboxylesterase/lipase family protein n=1 Tax=Saccharopolyspora sp. 6V TaxID=2877239 RepID=UPI001CD22976|nr:carboxylesterase family protein [Saccharopolyspora sp. 6V]MCA1192608.1 carboxylesterase family protein [Saccharopolyspora sp. 6V]
MARVHIGPGTVAGAEHDGVFRFLGMPYAAPPVGELRWAPPAPPAAWDGVRDATAFGPPAVQIADIGIDFGAPQSEDCLHLNVWSTTLDPEDRRPVMVWIHGGGFLGGASSMPEYSGADLARRGVTVVSFNYRLGAFGFLSHPDAGANAAVLDWVAALHWVAANISAFGGDPDNVTIFGQSAGAAAVRALLSAPAARGLFHRAIAQSAGFEDYAVPPSPSYDRITDASEEMFDRLGTRDLDELRRLPAQQVREASFALAGTPPAGQLHTPANLVWYPTTDGAVVADGFAGRPRDVPVLFGWTQHESRFFHRPAGQYARPDLDPAEIYTPEVLATMTRALAGSRADEVLARFGADGRAPYDALTELTTDAIWAEPAWETYQRFAGLGRTAYAYRFARVAPGARRSGLLAAHMSELPYLFGLPTGGDEYDEVDAAVSDTVRHAWTEFARTGVPRYGDGTAWPSCDAAAPRLTVIGDDARSAPVHLGPVAAAINSTREPNRDR